MHQVFRGSPTERGGNVEDTLKQLMRDLGNAINDSLSESERIAEAIGDIRKHGFDVFLVLEATIGFNRREDEMENATGGEVVIADKPSKVSAGKLRFTAQDASFLKALKIVSDE